MADEMTGLVLAAVGVPPYSARGLTEMLTPIGMSAIIRRTINGKLIPVQLTKFQKYALEVTGKDFQPPSFDNFWPGQVVTVDCVSTLAYLTATGTPQRTVAESWTDGAWTIYRPRLQMMITDFSIEQEEWTAGVGWSLRMEEI